MMAVVETEEFLADVNAVITDHERDALILLNAQADLAPSQRKRLASQLSALKLDWKEKKHQ